MATNAERRLQELELELPESPEPVGSYVPVVRTGQLVMTAGQIPRRDGEMLCEGKVPDEVSVKEAGAAARQCLLNALAAIRRQVDTLDGVLRVVRLNVYVNSSPGFTGQSDVANAASELLVEVFGSAGLHTRTAVGVAELPLNAPVELDLTVEVL